MISEISSPDKKAIERANGYRQMMGTWAWKDFHNSLKDERQKSLERCLHASSIEQVYLEKGYVKCLDSIESDLDDITGTRE